MNNQQLQQYMNNRGVSDTTLTISNIHYKDGRIVIPIHDKDGNFLFNKYRRAPGKETGPKYTYDKGATASLYGINFPEFGKEAFLCEGELDMLAVYSTQSTAFSTTGGSKTFREEWKEHLDEYDVTICYDNDDAGIHGTMNVLSHLGSAYVWFPPNQSDMTDYLVSGGSMADVLKERRLYTIPTTDKGIKQEIHNLLQKKRSLTMSAKSTAFVDAYIEQLMGLLKKNTPKKKMSGHGLFDISKAKQFPITSVLDFGPDSKTSCIWHNEETASLWYDKKQNRVYCFGCGKSCDVIDVVMQNDDCDFKTAVKKLTV